MHECTDRERKTELYGVLLFSITVVQQDLQNPQHNSTILVVDEGGLVDDVQKTGILSAPGRTPLRGVVVKLAIKRFSLHAAFRQPFAPNIL